MSTMNYQPYLQAILLIAKHYRIETSEERIRLQMDWAGASAADEVVKTIARQIGLSVRKSKFSKEMLNPWRLPVIVVFKDGQVGVVDQADVDHNVSIQMSGDQGLAQSFVASDLQHEIESVYILRPEKSVADARIDEYIKPYESSWFWSIVLRDWKRYIDIMFASLDFLHKSFFNQFNCLSFTQSKLYMPASKLNRRFNLLRRFLYTQDKILKHFILPNTCST
ncbi:peptidase, C39 family [Acinetobacter baumannii Naval-82]|nr:peptidase, C39 family [Acinetobacter baumannii Naval-82]